MKIHRFYAGKLHDKRGKLELSQKVWVSDAQLLQQWIKVLRFKEGDELSLFDDERTERLYRIVKVEPQAVGLELVTELAPKLPAKHIYLFWSLLKKDNNDLVLQKCTELGVSNFVPLISERTEKMGFDEARARRIIIEAAEQCGRTDIPVIREPISLHEALEEYHDHFPLFVADFDGEQTAATEHTAGVLIGPEGGWTEEERRLCAEHHVVKLSLGNLTLRAETAAIASAHILLQ